MTITALPTAPNPATDTPAQFSTNAAAWVAALATFVTEANALAAALNAIAAGGALTIPYTFSTTTTDADPEDGFLRLDNATQASATTIRADLVGADTTTYTDMLLTFDDSTSTITGHIMLQSLTTPTRWLLYSVSALASPAGYKNITVAYVAGPGGLTNNESITLKFTRTGDAGSAGTIPTAAAGGTVDAITATFSPAITLTDQQLCFVVLAGANATTTPTFAPNGLTAHTITKKGGSALAVGDLPGALAVACLMYNLANTRWELLNPAESVGNHEVVVHTGNGHGSTNTKIRRFTTAMTNVGTAITYADSASNGASFTINATGFYNIYYSDVYSAAVTYIGASVDSAQLTTDIQSINVANRLMLGDLVAARSGTISRTVYLTAGQVVRPHDRGSCDGADALVSFGVRKVGLV